MPEMNSGGFFLFKLSILMHKKSCLSVRKTVARRRFLLYRNNSCAFLEHFPGTPGPFPALLRGKISAGGAMRLISLFRPMDVRTALFVHVAIPMMLVLGVGGFLLLSALENVPDNQRRAHFV
ncbi:MAG: hypothetical protein ACLFPR_18255, partial [Desulfococcaceae bacterium]